MTRLSNQSNATILSERQRILQPLVFEEATVLTRDLPRDTCLKGLLFEITGSIAYLFASGTPLSDSKSIFDNLVENITITIDGSRTVKSVRPWLMRIQQLYASKTLPGRRSSAGAAQVPFPTVEQGFVYGTTGQITTIYEALYLAFENLYAKPGQGREFTWLMTKGTASAEIRIATKGFNALRAFGNTAPVVWNQTTGPVPRAHNIRIGVTTIEQQDVPGPDDKDPAVFSDWKQSTKQVPISGDVNGFQIELNKGNLLQSIQLFVEDGNAGGAALGSGNAPTNTLVTLMKLKINGQQDIKATEFITLQEENRQRYGLVAPISGNVSQLDGSVLWDFTREDDLQTSLDCRAPLVDQVHLVIDTRAGFAFNASKPATVTVMTNEIVMPAA